MVFVCVCNGQGGGPDAEALREAGKQWQIKQNYRGELKQQLKLSAERT